MRKRKRGLCRHCGRYRQIQARDLCAPCYLVRGIRDQYPAQFPQHATRSLARVDLEPTQAEVDRCVAEQLPTMPPERFAEEPPAAVPPPRAYGVHHRRGKDKFYGRVT